VYRGKAVYWQGKNKITKDDIVISDIEEGQAVVEVRYCGICGSDLAIYKGNHPRSRPPLIMGHEISGIIREVHSGKFKEGDSVVINPLISCGDCNPCREGYPYICQNLKLIGIDLNGGFAKYIIVDTDKLYKVQEDLDLKIATLIEPFAVGCHAFRIANPGEKDFVVILGGGPMGMAFGLISKYKGMENLYISEISQYRINKLVNYGFEVINPNDEDLEKRVKSITAGNLADIVIEATGASDPIYTMASLAKVMGSIIIVGISHKDPVINHADIVFKELSIKGIRVYSDMDFKDSMDFVYSNRDILSDYISEVYPLDMLEDALNCANDASRSTKVVVEI